MDENAVKRKLMLLLENPSDLNLVNDLFSLYKREGIVTDTGLDLINKAEQGKAFFTKKYKGCKIDYHIIQPNICIFRKIDELTASTYYKYNAHKEKSILTNYFLGRARFDRHISIEENLSELNRLSDFKIHHFILNKIKETIDFTIFKPDVCRLYLNECSNINWKSLLDLTHFSFQHIQETNYWHKATGESTLLKTVVDFLVKNKNIIGTFPDITIPANNRSDFPAKMVFSLQGERCINNNNDIDYLRQLTGYPHKVYMYLKCGSSMNSYSTQSLISSMLSANTKTPNVTIHVGP